MEEICVRNLGVGALEITSGKKRLLIDAFNSINIPEEIREGDLIIFTHDDGDHFLASKLPDLKNKNVALLGPPSITKPILIENKATIDQINTIYTKNNQEPACYQAEGVLIECINSEHFNHWYPIHNSYLIHFSERKIYITGDSLLTRDYFDIIGKVDVVVCNLVDEGYLTGRDDAGHAIHHNLSYLLSIGSEFKPNKMIGIHLLDFEGTVDPLDMKKIITEDQYANIIIPDSRDQSILL